MTTLTEREAAMLALERVWWRRPGSKEQAVREQLGLDATRYHQLLNQLIDREEALRADPVTVKRLRALRARRADRRMRLRAG